MGLTKGCSRRQGDAEGNRTLVDAVLRDYRTAPISDLEKALFAFIEKVNRESSRLRKEDVEEVKAAGVSDMTSAAYEASGERLATFGYVPPGGGAGK